MKLLFLLFALMLMSCTGKVTLLDKDVGYYTDVGKIKFKPIIFKNSKYALVVDYLPGYESKKTREKSNVIRILI